MYARSSSIWTSLIGSNLSTRNRKNFFLLPLARVYGTGLNRKKVINFTYLKKTRDIKMKIKVAGYFFLIMEKLTVRVKVRYGWVRSFVVRLSGRLTSTGTKVGKRARGSRAGSPRLSLCLVLNSFSTEPCCVCLPQLSFPPQRRHFAFPSFFHSSFSCLCPNHSRLLAKYIAGTFAGESRPAEYSSRWKRSRARRRERERERERERWGIKEA